MNLSDEEKSFCRSKKWYDESVAEAVKNITNVIDVNTKLAYNYNRMMNLTREPDKIEEYRQRKIDIELDNELRKRLLTFFEKYDSNQFVKDIIN